MPRTQTLSVKPIRPNNPPQMVRLSNGAEEIKQTLSLPHQFTAREAQAIRRKLGTLRSAADIAHQPLNVTPKFDGIALTWIVG